MAPIELPGAGVIPEHLSKQFLARCGIRIPEGRLAKSVEDACRYAREIGFPIALKAQASALAHKSDVGGVVLHIGDEAALREAWTQLNASVGDACPDLMLDGVLVEVMTPRGVEMVVGARRDAEWGPILVVGLGGVWVEVMGDVCLIPPSASEGEIKAAINQTRGAKLLRGMRWAPASDIDAVVEVVGTVAAVMRAMPDITEIDINPLVVHPPGRRSSRPGRSDGGGQFNAACKRAR